MSEIIINEEDWKVIEDRLKSMPEEFELGILEQSYTKQQLLREIKNQSEVGEFYVKMQVDLIKWLAKQGKII